MRHVKHCKAMQILKKFHYTKKRSIGSSTKIIVSSMSSVAIFFRTNQSMTSFSENFKIQRTTTSSLSILVGTCKDKKKNQDETDVDCGGIKCMKCADKKKCQVDNDCISDYCKDKKCASTYEISFHI